MNNMDVRDINRYCVYDTNAKILKESIPAEDISDKHEMINECRHGDKTDKETRRELLASIKKKIKSGYYHSNEVIEDLSESFAKAFDKALQIFIFICFSSILTL